MIIFVCVLLSLLINKAELSPWLGAWPGPRPWLGAWPVRNVKANDFVAKIILMKDSIVFVIFDTVAST